MRLSAALMFAGGCELPNPHMLSGDPVKGKWQQATEIKTRDLNPAWLRLGSFCEFLYCVGCYVHT